MCLLTSFCILKIGGVKWEDQKAERINIEVFRTKKHKLFAINTVKTVLDNPLYAGYIRYGKYKDWNIKRRKGLATEHILVEGNHEAIITKGEETNYLNVFENITDGNEYVTNELPGFNGVEDIKISIIIEFEIGGSIFSIPYTFDNYIPVNED